MLTPSQFAWSCCNAGDFPPPIPKKGERYGADAICCLCGGDTEGVGWPRKIALADTFTDVANMKCLASNTVCQACVATSKSEGWQQYVTAHPDRGFSAFFPKKDDKEPRGWNWLYSHHLFIWTHHHECPSREKWREILCNPPPPPFLAIYAAMGKKQIIFKGAIAQSQHAFYLQYDDDSILIRPQLFAKALADFDRLYTLGFSREGIFTGQYNPKTLLDVGIPQWQAAESPARSWRQVDPVLWGLCRDLTQRPEGWQPPIRSQSLGVTA